MAQRQAEDAALLVIRPQVKQPAIRQIIERAKGDALKAVSAGEVATTVGNELGNPIQLVPGPLALAEFEGAASELEADVKAALADFTNATGLDTEISSMDAFSAMLYALNQTGVNVQAAYDGIKR